MLGSPLHCLSSNPGSGTSNGNKKEFHRKFRATTSCVLENHIQHEASHIDCADKGSLCLKRSNIKEIEVLPSNGV